MSARAAALVAAMAGSLVGCLMGAVPEASADPQRAVAVPSTVSPIASRPAGAVTADGLPTTQIDGVAWSQVIVGNTVYVGGNFANARPAGAAPGTQLSPRGNLLAYDVTTGVLDPSFAPQLNGQVKAVAASPDGSRIYVGGSFTSADGKGRYRLAAYDTATGKLSSGFAPILSTDVNTIVATNQTVYVGGWFTSANGVARSRLAAFNASNGALTAWNPAADGNVNAMVLAPGGSKIIVGGQFQSVGGQFRWGLAAVDSSVGAVLPWDASDIVQNAGNQASITSLSTDGTSIFGTAYAQTGGNLEGAFSADPSTGAINWVESCHGDSYGAYPAAGVVYVVSHSHYCGDIGGFPQTDAKGQPIVQRATAFTTGATGTTLPDPYTHEGYADWAGTPSPSQINWYPDLAAGTFTGQSQAAWAITGNSQYVVAAGEFPRVNGTSQQGLVRFAAKGVTGNPVAQGPMVKNGSFMPTLTALSGDAVVVSWPSNWDRDDQSLTYKVVRNGATSTPIYSVTRNSQFWNRPSVSYTDTGLALGTTYSYRLYVVDADGNTVAGDTATITTPTTSMSAFVKDVINHGAVNYWRMDQPAGATTSVDVLGDNNLRLNSGVSGGAVGAINGDSNAASTFSMAASGDSATTNLTQLTPNLTGSAWFSTTGGRWGGNILGFNGIDSLDASSWAHNLWDIQMDTAGHVEFKVPDVMGANTVTSPKTYSDGKYHQVVATISNAGLALYVDGELVGTDTTVGTLDWYAGYWHVGGKTEVGDYFFDGKMDDVAIYPTALSLDQIRQQYVDSGRTLAGFNPAPVASFTNTVTGASVAADGSKSSDANGTISGYAWNWGDGSTGTGMSAAHTYATSGTYTVTLTVTDNQAATSTTTRTVTVLVPAAEARDAFGRTVTSGWGSADVGGAWTVAGSATQYAVNGSAATMTMKTAGSGLSATLNGTSMRDINLLIDTSIDKPATGGGAYSMLMARRSAAGEYRLKERFVAGGALQLILTKVVAGAEITVKSVNITGVTYTPGDVYRVRLKVTGAGSTSLSGSVWKAGTTEPATPQITAVDAEPSLQGAGGIGIQSYLSGSATTVPVVASYDNFTAG